MLALFSAALLDIMILCGLGLAAAPIAVDPALYPRQTALLVPKGMGAGVVRVPVPPELRSPRDPKDGSDLAVITQDGQPLAVATLRGQAPIDHVSVRMIPTEDPDVWVIDPLSRPLDGLELDLPAKEWVASVAVDEWATDHWQPLVESFLLWSIPAGAARQLDFPATFSTQTPDRLRLRLVRLAGPHNSSPRVEGLLHTAPSVAPVQLSLPVTQSVLEESGWSRYVVELPRPLPIDAVRVETSESVFERDVDVALISELDPERQPTSDGTIRRVHLGGASLDQLTIPVTDAPADVLVLWVQSKGLVPLDIPSVTVMMEGEALLVPSPGPGPLTLLGGADPGTTATGDLDLATPELSRMVQATLAPGPVEPNPAWVAPEQRAGLAEPGTLLDLRGMVWVHDVAGPTGLVRIVLTPDVLADCKVDHSDLRLVDSTDRQIPFLLRRRLVEDDLGALPFTRREVGPQSRLRVSLPTAGSHSDGPPLSTLRLTTAAPLFRRTITLNRLRGADLDPIRAYPWVGQHSAATLTLDVDAPVGDTLVLTIDNGDNPPLPIDTIMASVQSWELVARLPQGGARLVYGDPQRHAPDYDLGLLRNDLLARAVNKATLGSRSSLQPAAASALDRGLLMGGLLALVVGLAVLIIQLVRNVPSDTDLQAKATE